MVVLEILIDDLVYSCMLSLFSSSMILLICVVGLLVFIWLMNFGDSLVVFVSLFWVNFCWICVV